MAFIEGRECQYKVSIIAHILLSVNALHTQMHSKYRVRSTELCSLGHDNCLLHLCLFKQRQFAMLGVLIVTWPDVYSSQVKFWNWSNPKVYTVKDKVISS